MQIESGLTWGVLCVVSSLSCANAMCILKATQDLRSPLGAHKVC